MWIGIDCSGGHTLQIPLLDGRDGRIRTDDPLPPRQMRYQAALRPDVLRVPPLRAGGKYNG